MRICFITGDAFSLGGVQRVLSVVASELSKEHDVEIICTQNTKINRSMYGLDNKVIVRIQKDILLKKNILTKIYCKIGRKLNTTTNLFNNRYMSGLLENFYFPKEIKTNMVKLLNSKNYDIVIGVEGELSLLLGSIANRINAKTIGWQHNSYEAYLKNINRYYWKQDALFERLIPRLSKYIVLTSHDKNMFKKNNKIDSEVIFNPRSFKSIEKSSVNKKQFLAAGRFNYQKGFDLLIEAFNIFSRSDKEWSLVIVGEGEEQENLINLIKKYKLENRIKIERFTDNIKEYFLSSSVLLLSSRWEGMPMIALESLELGVPIIAYDITAVNQIIKNNIHGLIVPKFDIVEYANSMRICANSYDLREKMSAECIKRSREFDIEEIARKWDNLFQSLSNK